jgi:hypothetical protein
LITASVGFGRVLEVAERDHALARELQALLEKELLALLLRGVHRLARLAARASQRGVGGFVRIG